MQSRPYGAEDEIDLRELFVGLWRRRWVILGVTTAAAALAGTLAFLVAVFGVIVRDAWAAAPEAQGSAVGTLPEAR